MQPHAGVDVPVGFTSIKEVSGELFSKLHIRAAATPLPGVLWSREVSREVLHDTMDHTLPAVDGLQLQTVEFDSEGFLVPASLLITAASLQFAHRARIGHCVHHTGSCNGISKSALSEPYKDKGQNTSLNSHIQRSKVKSHNLEEGVGKKWKYLHQSLSVKKKY